MQVFFFGLFSILFKAIILYYLIINFGFTWYRDVRTSTLELSLEKLRVIKLNKEDVQKMHWKVVELKINSWIQYMQICVGFYNTLWIFRTTNY